MSLSRISLAVSFNLTADKFSNITLLCQSTAAKCKPFHWPILFTWLIIWYTVYLSGWAVDVNSLNTNGVCCSTLETCTEAKIKFVY